MTTYTHDLVGCRPEPLGSYLKALGLLRLIGEQSDPAVTGWWYRDSFVLESHLDDHSLARFLLERYQPTPLLSPWNSSSGFGPEGKGELQSIETSTDERLEPYRHAISKARALLARAVNEKWGKAQIVMACRAAMPDACVPWIDASVVLTGDEGLSYPPLFGTGGNLGRLELSRNFHQRVLDVMGLGPAVKESAPQAWLGDALWGLSRSTGLRGSSPGQFDPGAAGGVNSSPDGSADAVLNPWDFVLMLEGSLLFASGAARRLSAGARGRAAAPFTVDAAATGYPSATEDEKTKGELWVPLWERPVGPAELRRLFAEGRADWRGRHARSGLDMARVAGNLGVDRGVTAFSRYALVERMGQSTAAVAVGRLAVAMRPAVVPLADLDPWLDRVRSAFDPPAAVTRARRGVEGAIFAVASGGGPPALARVLVESANLEEAVAHSRSFRQRNRLDPVQGLDASRWLPALTGGGGGPELRLALALASSRDLHPETRRPTASLRTLLRPVTYVKPGQLAWTEHARVEGFGRRPVTAVLAEAHARRSMDLLAASRLGAAAAEGVGIPTRFDAGLTALLGDVGALAAGRLDDVLLGELIAGFCLLDWRPTDTGRAHPAPGAQLGAGVLAPALAVVGPFFAEQPPLDAELKSSRWEHYLAVVRLRPEASWPALLSAGTALPVLDAAVRRLRMAKLQPAPRPRWMAPALCGDAPRRLGAALLCRITRGARLGLLGQSCPDPDLSDEPKEPVDAKP